MTDEQQEKSAASPRRRLSSEQRREQILNTAEAQVLRSGLQHLTHRGIASELGVTHALVVHYEPDMGALRARVCESLLLAEYDETCARLASVPDAVAGVRELIALMSRPGREEMAAVWLDGWSLGRRHGPTAEVMRQMMDRWQGFVAELVSRGIAAGEFADVDAQACAWEAIALLDGLNAHTLVGYGDRSHYTERVAAPMEARLGLPHGTLALQNSTHYAAH
ncbi:transcriptional regulator [Kocuria varians]|uniref:Transcriptional regulator n=1 Tax=Kocuria varians TaxID=1272 RepID=A0A4Y4D2W6_KOCVA|nr:TetR family transcriptional regulator C-terminal domain-containing protein [Kocuria varians]GEC98299.1 transcriptional regulator [Kocuria varians]